MIEWILIIILFIGIYKLKEERMWNNIDDPNKDDNPNKRRNFRWIVFLYVLIMLFIKVNILIRFN